MANCAIGFKEGKDKSLLNLTTIGSAIPDKQANDRYEKH